MKRDNSMLDFFIENSSKWFGGFSVEMIRDIFKYPQSSVYRYLKGYNLKKEDGLYKLKEDDNLYDINNLVSFYNLYKNELYGLSFSDESNFLTSNINLHTIQSVLNACMRKKIVSMKYYSRRSELRKRNVEINRVFLFDNELYIRGREKDENNNIVKTFKVSRIENINVEDVFFKNFSDKEWDEKLVLKYKINEDLEEYEKEAIKKDYETTINNEIEINTNKVVSWLIKEKMSKKSHLWTLLN